MKQIQSWYRDEQAGRALDQRIEHALVVEKV